jgi:hypothetical protein
MNIESSLKISNRVGIRTCYDFSRTGVELDGRKLYVFGFHGQKKEAQNESFIKGDKTISIAMNIEP